MIGIKIAFIILIAMLWRLGGWQKAKWSGYRDVLVPIFTGIWLGLALKVWWAAIPIAGAAQIIRMGYGAYDPEHDDKPSLLAKLTHDRQGYIIRSIVGAARALVVGLVVCFFAGHWFLLFGYVAQCGLVGFLVSKLKLKDWPAEILEGLSFISLIIWICH
jgi:hypothetical protein